MTQRGLLVVAILWLLAGSISSAYARLLTAAEETTLAELDAHGYPSIQAAGLARELGRENNLDAVPVLLRLNKSSLLSYFASTYRAQATPELEALVLPYLREPTHWAASNLSMLLHNYHSREVFDALHQSARQRLILLQSPQTQKFALNYPRLDELTRTDLKDIEEPVSQLLPLASSAAEVYNLVTFLGQRGYVQATDRLAALLRRSAAGNGGNVAYVLMRFETVEATSAVIERLRWLMTQPPDERNVRDEEIAVIVELLGTSYRNQLRTSQEEMDRIEADLAKLTLTPEVKRKLNVVFERHYGMSLRADAMAAEHAPIPGPWTQEACEHSSQELIVMSDGPTIYVGKTREEVREMKAKSQKIQVQNQAFCYGLKHGHKEVFDACAGYQIDFNKPCALGETPLSHAVSLLDYDLIEQVIGHGADPKRLRIPSHPQSGNLVLNVLMKCGREKNEQNSACERILRRLVELGADINGPPEAMPNIHYAANDRNLTMIALLVSLGADIDRKNEYGGSILDYAELSGNTNLAEFIKAHGGHSNLVFQTRVRAGKGLFLLICATINCKM